MKTSIVRLFTIAILSSAITIAATEGTLAHGSMGGSGRGIVPVHGSPKLGGGVLVTHGNLKFTQNIVRDHRTGLPGRRCGGSQPCWGPGGLAYGQKAAQLPYGYQLPQGGHVRDHRH